jgi:phosphatidylinositol 4-kinase
LSSYFITEKSVFADIEFYLPQIAHMIIHVSQNSEEFPMKKLAIAIAQVSIHAALQLSFMFTAAMEDYQPEISTGQPNPSSNTFLFKRCATLLQEVEKTVIYGKEVSASSLPYTTNPLKDVAEREVSVQNEFSKVVSGTLLYKRNTRKSNFHSKPWKPRFFIVDQRILLCFRDSTAKEPLRAILLTSCRVVVSETHPKYGDCCFELISDSSNTRYLLRTESSDQRKSWVAAILRYAFSCQSIK